MTRRRFLSVALFWIIPGAISALGILGIVHAWSELPPALLWMRWWSAITAAVCLSGGWLAVWYLRKAERP